MCFPPFNNIAVWLTGATIAPVLGSFNWFDCVNSNYLVVFIIRWYRAANVMREPTQTLVFLSYILVKTFKIEVHISTVGRSVELPQLLGRILDMLQLPVYLKRPAATGRPHGRHQVHRITAGGRPAWRSVSGSYRGTSSRFLLVFWSVLLMCDMQTVLKCRPIPTVCHSNV